MHHVDRVGANRAATGPARTICEKIKQIRHGEGCIVVECRLCLQCNGRFVCKHGQWAISTMMWHFAFDPRPFHASFLSVRRYLHGFVFVVILSRVSQNSRFSVAKGPLFVPISIAKPRLRWSGTSGHRETNTRPSPVGSLRIPCGWTSLQGHTC